MKFRDRKIYQEAKHESKRLYDSYGAAAERKGQFPYWCEKCQGYHRTSYPTSSEVQIETLKHAEIVHAVGGDNIFADVGLPDDYLAKSNLVMEIDRIIAERELTQREAAEILGVDQPRVSALLSGKLNLFSVEKLGEFVKRLGSEVEITVDGEL